MRSDIYHTLGSTAWETDFIELPEIVGKLRVNGDNCYFCFDLLTDKCTYFCPSITRFLGYDPRNFRNKGLGFFRKLIHPEDFMLVLDEVINLVSSAEKSTFGLVRGQQNGIFLHLRHKKGDWQKCKLKLHLLKEPKTGNYKILLGFLGMVGTQKDSHNQLPPLITDREKEVFRYLSEGDSAKIIACKLGISESTVVSHRKNLIEKLGVKNSAELIKRGFELHILKMSEVFT